MHVLRPILISIAIATTASAIAAAVDPADTTTFLSALSRRAPGTHNDSGSKSKSKLHKPGGAKYFHEAGGGMEMGHYDARYFAGKVAYAQHRASLQHLIRSYLTVFRQLGVETWLAHGSLLGWWWNGRIMPWDYDLDVQVTTVTLRRLGEHLNGTTHAYSYADPETGREVTKTYLLDVNPHHTEPGRGDGANVIDARWIDTSNGMFVDITGLAERGEPSGRSPGTWSCKNRHRYRTTQLWPMRTTEFEGVPATVPYAFDRILTGEYGAKSLVGTEWAGHRWMPDLKEWVKVPKLPKGPKQKTEKPKGGGGDDGDNNNNVVVVVVEETVVKQG